MQETSARRWLRSVALVLCWTLGSLATATTAFAQASNAATLQVTAVDATGAVIVGATVTVTSAESSAAVPGIAPVQTSDRGIATISGLAPGRYNVDTSFPGFETRVLKDVRIRS